ncbi:multicopper oxidase domain-containing protein [Nitrososphaera sp.]|uniref:multicopper oxidase domain-containing protein n=1 Tax=Nitrososphaera sp. TaxID=1971748 RepID=UPI001801CE4B|nr:multicopper oxidase domain-containing protein [Nitrososphaera sp.]NWG38238.1 multicopper oxidase domain-containing protein [Nitrososphaera sp.]
MSRFSKTLAASVAVAVVLTGAGGYLTLGAESDDEHHTNASQGDARQARTVEYTLVAQNTTLEIAPGVRVEAWTYNGTIPGPVLRATEGDRVILHFLNKTPMPHTVHLHGDHDEKDDGVFQTVNQGESYTYDFIAGPPGALMYHCHVMPVTQHVRMGLYGALIIDPREGLTPAREYVLVAGEYDTKDQLTSNPEYVFFNGYADQYFDNPLQARTNETVRIYYVNMGASPAYGFHIHGTIFDAYPSGILQNDPLKVQTWEVAAGNGAIFEARWPWEGRYLFHIHGLPEERGTMAYFDVTDAPDGAVDGVDIARTKSISMIEWQENLAKSLQKQDPDGVANTSSGTSRHSIDAADVPPGTVSIPEGAAADTDLTFAPAEISVGAGETVTWVNDDSTLHTVDSRQEGLFSSGMLSPKRTFEHTFAEPGTYEYYCSLHPWMTGTVSVR